MRGEVRPQPRIVNFTRARARGLDVPARPGRQAPRGFDQIVQQRFIVGGAATSALRLHERLLRFLEAPREEVDPPQEHESDRASLALGSIGDRPRERLGA